MMTRGSFRAAVGVARARGHKPHRLPRQAEPVALKARYMKRIKSMVVEPAMALVRAHLIPRLEAMAAREPSRIAVRDASDLDNELADIIDELKDTYFATFTRKEFSKVVRPMATEGARFQASQLNKQLSAALGEAISVDVVGNEPWLLPAIESFTRENVALIKTIPEQFFSELEKSISAGLADGDRWEDLASGIEDRYSVSESRAELIALVEAANAESDLGKAA